MATRNRSMATSCKVMAGTFGSLEKSGFLSYEHFPRCPYRPPRPAGLDPELAAALIASSPALPPVARGDWQAQRQASAGFYDLVIARVAAYPAVRVTTYATRSTDGTEIALRWHSPADTSSGAAVVYVHGGGMIAGTIDHADALVRPYVQAAGVPFLTADYRLASEVQGRTLVEDALAGLTWLLDHASVRWSGNSGQNRVLSFLRHERQPSTYYTPAL
jgi:acetyl esterase/lipase